MGHVLICIVELEGQRSIFVGTMENRKNCQNRRNCQRSPKLKPSLARDTRRHGETRSGDRGRGGPTRMNADKIWFASQRSFCRVQLCKEYTGVVIDANHVLACVGMKKTLKFLHHRRVGRIVL